MKEDIEEAQLVEETTSMVLVTEHEKPTLPTILNKEDSLAKINEAYEKYASIEIADTKDKANYDKVVTGIRELRESRLFWDKSVDENLFGPAKEWFNKLKKDYDDILVEFKAKEALLKAKKTAIDDKKKEEKAAEDARKLKVFSERVQKLVELGGKPLEANYVFDYDLTLFVKIATLKDLDDAKWEKVLSEIKAAHEGEQKRIEDEKNEAANKLVEANKLVSSLTEKQRRLRLKELKQEGFVESILGEGLFEHPTAYPGKTVSMKDVDNMPDEEWDGMIIDFSGYEPPVEEEDIAFVDEAPVYTEPLVETTAPSAMQPSVHFEEDAEMIDLVADPLATLVERTLVFSADKPFIDVSLSGVLTQRLFPDDYRELALENLTKGTYEEGQVDESLLFVVFKK